MLMMAMTLGSLRATAHERMPSLIRPRPRKPPNGLAPKLGLTKASHLAQSNL